MTIYRQEKNANKITLCIITFLLGGIMTRAGRKRSLVTAGTAFAIGRMAPCA